MLYPLKFHPILKEKIWGGNKLKTILNKPSTKDNIGESWEISTLENNTSIISNGFFEGKSLTNLIKKFKGELLGQKVYSQFGDQFPLLIKFIDAKEDLSVQLHPNDVLAKERHNSFGKTEMWHVVQADQNAELIIGFKKDTTKQEYESFLKNSKITELLNFENISKGDSYFIDAGRIHAIGGGALIAEIQQTSDVTYRVYDWDRADNQGNKRELHTDLALDALDFKAENNFRLDYNKKENSVNEIVQTKYFTTNFIHVKGNFQRDYEQTDSFKILMCVAGRGNIISNGLSTPFSLGETVLIPSIVNKLSIESDIKEAKLLEVYI